MKAGEGLGFEHQFNPPSSAAAPSCPCPSLSLSLSSSVYCRKHHISVAMDSENHSPELFHAMAAQQEAAMRACLAQQAHVSPADLAYEEGKYAQAALDLAPEAVQACAYDRYHFGRPGTGRIAIGVYWAFLHRWLQVWRVCVRACGLALLYTVS